VAVKMKREAELHSRLHHPNIVQMIAMVFEENNYGIILEFMQYGELDYFLSEYGPSWAFRLLAANQIATGMCYLHSLKMPVIHGDLKIQNVLVGDGFKVKVSFVW
jgi:serine/threonine protein kinase